MKKLILKVLGNLIGGIVGCALVIGFFAMVGMLVNFMETHIWAFVIMLIIVIISIIKMASKAE